VSWSFDEATGDVSTGDVLARTAWAQPRKPATLAEIVTYNGADREQVLYNGAKGEGKSFGILHWQGIPIKPSPVHLK
jgi:hypothetical protein